MPFLLIMTTLGRLSSSLAAINVPSGLFRVPSPQNPAKIYYCVTAKYHVYLPL